MKEKVGSEFFRYHKRFSELYDSYKDFSKEKPKQQETGGENNVAVPAWSILGFFLCLAAHQQKLNKMKILFN